MKLGKHFAVFIFDYNHILMLVQAGERKKNILVLEASGGVNVKCCLPACEAVRNKIFKEENQIKKGEKKDVCSCAKVKGDMLLDDYSGSNASWLLLLDHLLFK